MPPTAIASSGRRPPVDVGTLLLLQSPAAGTSESIDQRGVEITQAAEDLGFGNMWLAEHHVS
jgi:alkanesulfonate monooxygenase SsuD/methylene tetrahydromethanopterin reductase-like flavin-dependent oxidoreductase (luciferase family)